MASLRDEVRAAIKESRSKHRTRTGKMTELSLEVEASIVNDITDVLHAALFAYDVLGMENEFNKVKRLIKKLYKLGLSDMDLLVFGTFRDKIE